MKNLDPAPFYNLRYMRDIAPVSNHMGYPSHWFVKRVQRTLDNIQEFIMPKKAKSGSNGNGFPMTEFVHYKLNAQEKKDFVAWKSKHADNLETFMVDMMQKGYKMSVSFDDTNDCWIGSATCKDEGSGNHNKCLTSRSDAWYDALLMNVFKTTELCNDMLWDDLQQEADLG